MCILFLFAVLPLPLLTPSFEIMDVKWFLLEQLINYWIPCQQNILMRCPWEQSGLGWARGKLMALIPFAQLPHHCVKLSWMSSGAAPSLDTGNCSVYHIVPFYLSPRAAVWPWRFSLTKPLPVLSNFSCFWFHCFPFEFKAWAHYFEYILPYSLISNNLIDLPKQLS